MVSKYRKILFKRLCRETIVVIVIIDFLNRKLSIRSLKLRRERYGHTTFHSRRPKTLYTFTVHHFIPFQPPTCPFCFIIQITIVDEVLILFSLVNISNVIQLKWQDPRRIRNRNCNSIFFGVLIYMWVNRKINVFRLVRLLQTTLILFLDRVVPHMWILCNRNTDKDYLYIFTKWVGSFK